MRYLDREEINERCIVLIAVLTDLIRDAENIVASPARYMGKPRESAGEPINVVDRLPRRWRESEIFAGALSRRTC